MAVVFVSPKEKQRVFFVGISVAFALFVAFFSLFVFLAPPSAGNKAVSFNKPKVAVDMAVLDSKEFQALKPISQLNSQYAYTATTKEGRKVAGFISAASREQASQILDNMKYKVLELKPADIGRQNPFIPYYQPAPATNKNTSRNQ